MGSIERTVQRLKLRAPNEALVRRGALSLEDALRTASLPDSGSRLLVVRRLDLGRLRAGASAQSLALSIEQLVARQQASFVHGVRADAAVANGVWFRDALEAHTALACRVAAGLSAQEWFWPLAVAGWQRTFGQRESLRWLAFSLARRPEAAAALPQWARALVRAGWARAVLDALQPGDGAALLHGCGSAAERPDNADRMFRHRPRRTGRGGPPRRDHGQPEDADTDGRSRAQTEEMDDRLTWLRAMLAGSNLALPSGLAALYSADASPATPQATAHPIAAHESPVSVDEPWQDAATSSGERDHGAALPKHGAAVPRNAPPSETDTHAEAMHRAMLQDDAGVGLPHRLGSFDIGMDIEIDTGIDGEPTQAGGLLFLLPVMNRLGYARWNAARRSWECCRIAQQMLRLVLHRLAIAQDDPAWRILDDEAPAKEGAPRSFVAPPSWRSNLIGEPRLLRLLQHDGGGFLWDASGSLMLAGWRGRPTQPIADLLAQCDLSATEVRGVVARPLAEFAADAWLAACSLWLQRYAGLELDDLVRRPANLSLTPTHADLYFDHRHADLRIRRAGLDIDPGWLPWFGRVVAFHYEVCSGS